MIHPIMPPATGPTGALLIMLRDATSSSAAEREEKREERGMSRRLFKGVTKDFRWLEKWQFSKPVSNSLGSDPHSHCYAGTFSTFFFLFSHQREMPQKNYSTASKQPILLLKKLITEPKENNQATEKKSVYIYTGNISTVSLTTKTIWLLSSSVVAYSVGCIMPHSKFRRNVSLLWNQTKVLYMDTSSQNETCWCCKESEELSHFAQKKKKKNSQYLQRQWCVWSFFPLT